MKVITTRIEDEYFEDLKEIEKDEKTEMASVMRKLLAQAIKEWKLKKALSLLKERKLTIRKAASFAEVISGSVTNSIKGTPALLKSTNE